jgi:hypothetical protein
MYCCSQQSGCFWNRFIVAWPCRPEPTGDWTVLTTAVRSVTGLRYHVTCYNYVIIAYEYATEELHKL